MAWSEFWAATGMRFPFYSLAGFIFTAARRMVRRKLEDPDPQNKSNMNWYYDQGGQRQGPVDDSQLDLLIAQGTVRAETLVWREGMADWAPLSQARPSSEAATGVPEGWIRCTATGRYFPPSQIVYIDGKPYSAEAKAGVVQGVLQSGQLPDTPDELRVGPPWEQRAQLGLIKAAWETVKLVLIDPNGAFSAMKRTGGLGTPLAFYMIVGGIGFFASVVYQVFMQAGTMTLMPPELRQQGFAETTGLSLGLIFILSIVATPIFMLMQVFLGSGLLHLSLMICGGANRDFETTFRTYCYSRGAGIALCVIPICGGLGGLWGLVCLCMGIAKTQQIGTGRAVCAVLLPTVICCTLTAVAAFAIVGLIASAQGLKH
jgi:hypothetical protein